MALKGRKLLISWTFAVRKLFKGDNYSREETILGNTISNDESGFKGGACPPPLPPPAKMFAE